MRPTGVASLVAAALALLPAAAQASTALPIAQASPSGRVALAPMTDLVFSARFLVPIEDARVVLSMSPPDADGLLPSSFGGGPMTTQPFSERLSWHLPIVSSLRTAPGVYWWQVEALVKTERGTVQQVSAAQRVDTYFPGAWSKRGPIDRRFGRHGRAHFLLSTRGIPSGVRARVRTLVSLSARRWGLHLDGWTARSAEARDGVNVAGFGAVPVAGALAVQRDAWSSRYRLSQHCVNGRCGPVERHVVERVRTDQDLIIRTDVRWGLGPARPTLEQFDLETVVIHELGHLAGNPKHKPRCSNTPMGAALARGEWWHTPHDWYRRGCPLTQPGGLL
jgi:hypothetical protein